MKIHTHPPSLLESNNLMSVDFYYVWNKVSNVLLKKVLLSQYGSFIGSKRKKAWMANTRVLKRHAFRNTKMPIKLLNNHLCIAF